MCWLMLFLLNHVARSSRIGIYGALLGNLLGEVLRREGKRRNYNMNG